MSFNSLVASLDSAVQSVFSESTVTIHPQSGQPDIITATVVKNPKFEEDYNPLTVNPNPVSLLLFVRLVSLSPVPKHGDTATFGGEDYDIFDVDADREGGGTLKLRKRNQRWDQ
jgi:hypothetical protein